ncbi:unnamed protein product [Effrenium voratum]|nr:unnamed protein product [Effrenium voratum]
MRAIAVTWLPWCIRASTNQLTDDELLFHWDCASRCAAMTDADRVAIGSIYRSANCDVGGPGAHPVCASSPEQLCAGICGGKAQDMAAMLRDSFAPGTANAREDEFSEALEEHHNCASRCASEGVAVSVKSAGAAGQALETLQRCGVVQLLDGYDPDSLDRFDKAFDLLKSKEKAYKKLLDRKQLHDGRFQVYLPYTKPFSSRQTLGVSDLVLEILTTYFEGSGNGFGIDHATVLTSATGSGNQSLHPDVHYFKGLSVSVHTALRDVPLKMGPTFFCPCTGEALSREEWPVSAAIKMTVLKRKDCLASSLAPKLTKRGTVTIYDGAMFHKALGQVHRSLFCNSARQYLICLWTAAPP